MRTARCSKCNVELNLDAIGMSLPAWNLEHNRVTGCTGIIMDPELEEEMKKQVIDPFVQKALDEERKKSEKK